MFCRPKLERRKAKQKEAKKHLSSQLLKFYSNLQTLQKVRGLFRCMPQQLHAPSQKILNAVAFRLF
jgi:hypothetical protein